MPALHGFIVLCPLATPTIGLSKSPSLKPTARSIARFGERATPWVMIRLRRLLGIGESSLALSYNRWILTKPAAPPSPMVTDACPPAVRSGCLPRGAARRALVRPDVLDRVCA